MPRPDDDLNPVVFTPAGLRAPEPLDLGDVPDPIEERVKALGTAIAAVQRPVDWLTWTAGLLNVEVLTLAEILRDALEKHDHTDDPKKAQAMTDLMRVEIANVLRRLEARTTEGLRR
jgi:hypothetical protein